MSRSKAVKCQEFVAHAGPVNCVHVGRQSGSVMVTGGEDKKVNLWSIGKPNAIMSLSGHTSAVECVSFDSSERTVIAGSAGGTLKMWDLEHGRVARTLTGHRSNCVAVQWHPYGEFFASGSVDTNLKIWDIRRRACIQTYRGHSKGVRHILFSPDGRWVVSGGDDGVVKLWDLTAGKMLHEFTMHPGPICALAIHPTEFLMATAATDRTIRLWDLETFEQICATQPDLGQIRHALFSEDGNALISGGEESLRVWGWEPVRCHEHSDVRWSKLSDLSIGPGNLLIGASLKEAVVSVWRADLNEMRPFNGTAPPTPDGVRTPAGVGAGGSYARRGTPASRGGQRAATADRPSARVHSMDAFGDSPPARPLPQVPRSAPPFALHDDSHLEDAPLSSSPAGARRVPPAGAAAPKPTRSNSGALAAGAADSVACGAARGVSCSDNDELSASACARIAIADCRAQIAAARSSRSSSVDGNLDGPTPKPGCAPAGSDSSSESPAAAPSCTGEPISVAEAVSGAREIGTSMGDSILQSGSSNARLADGFDLDLPPPKYGRGRNGGAGSRPGDGARAADPPHRRGDGPRGLDPAQFMPKSAAPATVDDEILLTKLLQSSALQTSCLSARLTSLRALRRFWDSGDAKGMLQHLQRVGDPSIAVDVLRAGVLSRSQLDLEGALILLPLLRQLLLSEHDEHIETSLDALALLLSSFGSMIASSVNAPPPMSVDLSGEARIRRCKECYTHFEEMRSDLRAISATSGVKQRRATDLLHGLSMVMGLAA